MPTISEFNSPMTPLIAWFVTHQYDKDASWYAAAIVIWFVNFVLLADIVFA